MHTYVDPDPGIDVYVYMDPDSGIEVNVGPDPDIDEYWDPNLGNYIQHMLIRTKVINSQRD